MPGQDHMKFEILEDGTIKVITDPISGPNHVNAEQFLRLIGQMAGGEVTRTRRMDVHRNISQTLHDHAADGHTHN